MAKNPLFSTYRQGENRVTSSMLAVFERIDLSLLEELLTAATGESSLQLVSFVNQPPGRGASVPDGRISARFSYWFEVKTVPDAVSRRQLDQHLHSLTDDDQDERLFVVTPDAVEPAVVAELNDTRVVWFSFASLHDAIGLVLEGSDQVISERTEFLLRELQALIVDDGLLDHDDVVVVAARVAYGEYLNHAAYICQPGRSFREGLTYLGFYASGAIQREVARILYREDGVPFGPDEVERRRTSDDPFDQRMASVIEAFVGEGARQASESYQVFLLTPAESQTTLILERPILNTKRAASGRPWAWTLHQRYVNSRQLVDPAVGTTEDLEAG
ncbi:hypothetical protein [Egicoccus sp. AB-alg2]|uniref:hypothetical protein n=1 Tax=Egicoccus sp. AB-alg2 TaxID=3242693 RepID=UPI00359E96FC